MKLMNNLTKRQSNDKRDYLIASWFVAGKLSSLPRCFNGGPIGGEHHLTIS